jgi:LemA protein
MTFSLVLWIVVATLSFWCVGVYNRLTRMRARYMDAMGSLKKHVTHLISVARKLDRGSHQLSSAGECTDSGEYLAPLLRATEELEVALHECGNRLLATGAAQDLTHALYSLDIRWRNWIDAPSDLAGPLIPTDIQMQWELAYQRVEVSKGGLNQLVAKYNEAIDQYPARLLARVAGFRTAGAI